MDTKDGQGQEKQEIKAGDVGKVEDALTLTKVEEHLGIAGEPERKNPAASLQEQAKQANDATLGAIQAKEAHGDALRESLTGTTAFHVGAGTASAGTASHMEGDFNKKSELLGDAHGGTGNLEKQEIDPPLHGTAAGDILDRIRTAIHDFEHAVALELHQEAREAHAFMVDCMNELRGHFRSS